MWKKTCKRCGHSVIIDPGMIYHLLKRGEGKTTPHFYTLVRDENKHVLETFHSEDICLQKLAGRRRLCYGEVVLEKKVDQGFDLSFEPQGFRINWGTDTSNTAALDTFLDEEEQP